METLKQQIVCGFIMRIQSTLPETRIIPTSLIWLIVIHIDNNDIFLSQYWKSAKAREIIHIQVGQCGNQIGNIFWDTICNEHKLNKQGKFELDPTQRMNRYIHNYDYLDKIHIYFNETETMKFVPRACCIDLEPGIIDIIKTSPIGPLFKPDNICYGASGAGNNWAKGHYTDGAYLSDEVIDIIRRETESCNCPQGFQLTHSIGGGTGSGMGTLLLLKIRDNYPDRIISTFSVYPSPKLSDVVVEPYNATLCIDQLLENSDETFVIDNEALFHISHNVLKQRQPKYCDLNWVISLVMCGITCSLRYSGQLNCDLRKMAVNLVPFPRLHFFLLSQAPLHDVHSGCYGRIGIAELTDQMWSSRRFLANVKPEDGKYITAAAIYRGVIGTQEVEDENAKVGQKLADDFITWIPNNIKTSVINIPTKYYPLSGTFIANTTAIKGVFQRINAQFAKMYERKAFLHWYKGEGMDEMEFQEANKNVTDLVTEYQDKQDAVVDLDYTDEEDDDEEEYYTDENEDDEDEDEDEGFF